MFPHPEDEAYNRFVRTLIATRTVYTLSLIEEDEIAECPSAHYDDERGEPVPVYCFWQEQAAAEACRAEEWADYEAEAVPLDIFMEHWLIGMDQEAALAGLDFDPQLYGLEIEPVELLGDLLDAAFQQGITLPQHAELTGYRLQWEREMSGQSHLH
ncbi:MAG: DUF2750 domain-containing protein [Neisseria sp.]|nr:DUF2750 domain-containing protein [Neisseria sp.]